MVQGGHGGGRPYDFARNRPVNRCVGRKIYAPQRHHVSLSVKKEMSIEGEETTIKPQFQPEDTLHDVWKDCTTNSPPTKEAA